MTDQELDLGRLASASFSGEMEPISVIVPAYNEHQSIERTIDELRAVFEPFGWPYEIIIVDDGSKDGTGDIAKRTGVLVLSHKRNRGYGASIKTGIRHAKYDVIGITDADGTYPNADFPRLMAALSNNDMAVGARTGQSVHIPLIRRPAKWFLRALSSYLVNHPIPDINSGMRVFRREPAQRFIGLYPDGFSLTTTITLAFLSNGYAVEFLPIDYFNREGVSKIRPIRDTVRFTTLTVRTVMYFQPLKIFGPVSVALLALGTIRTIYHVAHFNDVMTSDLVLLLGGINILAIGLLADLIDKRT